jgi:hypothetical protein
MPVPSVEGKTPRVPSSRTVIPAGVLALGAPAKVKGHLAGTRPL